MPKFRKKPVVIEAFQWTGQPLAKMPEWFQDRWSEIGHDNRDGSHVLVIPTLEGEHIASFHDWIIKGVQGEMCPCKPDIFKATYEAA